MEGRGGPMKNANLFVKGLGLLAVVAGAILFWHLRGLVLIVFAGALIAILLDAAAGAVRRVVPVGQTISVIISVVVLLGLLIGTFALLGAQTLAELSELNNRLPALIRKLESTANLGSIESWLSERFDGADGAASVLSGLSGVTWTVVGAASGVLLAMAGGLFFAINPACYRNGAVRLLPHRFRRKGRDTLAAIGSALRAWLIGQLVAMLAVGLMTTLGLWALGVSTPIGLGVIAGILEFVPYVGPVASSVPAIAVAFVDSPTTALWVALLYVGVQQVEGALLIPLIQQEAVDLPPAVTVFAVVAFGVLFGPAGFVLAAPLMVVAVVLVRELWSPYVDRPPAADEETGTSAPAPR